MSRKEVNQCEGDKVSFPGKAALDPWSSGCRMAGWICLDMLEVEEVRKVRAVMAARH